MAGDERELRVDLKVTGADEAVSDLEAFGDAAGAVEDLGPVTVDVDAAVDPGAESDLEFLERQLRDLDGVKVAPTVSVNVDEAALDRARAGLRQVDDAATDVGTSVPGSAGALRDVSGALGDVGGGALDAAEGLMGLGETLGQISPKLAGVGELLGKLGFVGAIGGLGLNLLVQGINNLNGSAAALEGGAKKITTSVGNTSAAFDELARGAANNVTFGEVLAANVVHLGDTLQKVFGQAVPSAGDRLKSFKKVLEESAPAAAHLVDELAKTGDIDPAELAKFNGLIDDQLRSSALLADQQRELESTQTVYNEAVAAGIDIAGKSADAVRDELGAMKLRESVSHQTAVGLEDDQARIAAAMTAAAEAGATANQKNRDEVDRLRSSIDKLNEATDEQRGAILTEAEARVRSTEAQKRYNESITDGKHSLDEQTVAAVDNAEAFADVLEAGAKANGQTFTTEQRQAAVRASLQSTADKAKGPLHDAITGIITDYDKVPPTVHTEATLNADQALAELNALIRKTQAAQQELDILRYKAEHPGAPIGVLGSTPNSTSSSTFVTINVPPTLNPNAVVAAVGSGRRRNGALRRG